MNLLRRLLRALVIRDPALAIWLGGGPNTEAGVSVNGIEAMKCAAVLACIRILAETLAMVPLKVFEELPNGGKRPAIEHPLYSVLHLQPNPEMTSFEWRERLMIDCSIFGVHFSQQVPDLRRNVVELWPLEAERCKPVRARLSDGTPGALEFEVTRGNGSPKMFDADEILYVPLMPDEEMKGRSLVNLTRETIGLTFGAEWFAARFFRNDATPRLFLESETMTPDEAGGFGRAWKEAHAGEKQHSVGILYGGLKAKLLQGNLKDLQLTEVRKFQLNEVCRIFRVPPHLVQDLDRATNNNIEEQGIDFRRYGAHPWASRIEQRMQVSLLSARERNRYRIEFVLDGLERGSFASRAEGLAKQIASAQITPNEARALENRPALPGGEKLYIQGAMIPLEMAGQQPEEEEEEEDADADSTDTDAAA